jgi:hypothetical protein
MHSGNWGKVENLIRNLNIINDKRIIIENTFYRNTEDFRILKWVITTTKELMTLKENNVDFCFDFSHHIIDCKFAWKDYKK